MNYLTQSAVCLLEQAAEKFKNRTVFEDKDGKISFAQLREKSRIVASELMKSVPTGRKNPVIVYLPKSINSIISFMGALYSASPYVPIDYAIPLARMVKTVDNLCPAAIITDSEAKRPVQRWAGCQRPAMPLLGQSANVFIFQGAATPWLGLEFCVIFLSPVKRYSLLRVITDKSSARP